MKSESELNMPSTTKRKIVRATWNSDEIDALHLQEVGERNFLKTTSDIYSPLARQLRRINGRKISCNSNKPK